MNRAARSPGVDEVHDLRVATRRFTQVLRIFKPCFPSKESKRIRQSLKKTMAVAGEVRDLDIAAGLLGKSKLTEARLLQSRFRAQRRSAEQMLADRLQHWRSRQMSHKWRRKLLLASPNPEAAEMGALEEVARQTVPRLMQQFFAAGRSTSNGTAPAKQLHELRLAAKKLRYTLEPFAPLHKAVLPARIEQLKKLQGILGDINDLEIVRKMVLKEDSGRRLPAELARRRDRRIEEFWAFWKAEFAGAPNLVQWKKDLTFFPPSDGAAPKKPPAQSETARGPAVGPTAAVR
jgi:CHAD domain-containing protein